MVHLREGSTRRYLSRASSCRKGHDLPPSTKPEYLSQRLHLRILKTVRRQGQRRFLSGQLVAYGDIVEFRQNHSCRRVRGTTRNATCGLRRRPRAAHQTDVAVEVRELTARSIQSVRLDRSECVMEVWHAPYNPLTSRAVGRFGLEAS
jgi:hypothetical protein